MRTSPQTSPDPRSNWIRVADVLSVTTFVLLWSAVAIQLARAYSWPHLLVAAALTGPAAILLADLASGCVHWFADRYFDPQTPVIGPMLIEPFRAHHRDPTAMSHHGFFEISGNNGLVTLPLAALLLARGSDANDSVAMLGLQVATLLFALLIFVTNQIHAYAHAAEAPAWVRRMQAARLVLSPEAHAVHHENGFDRAYCITTGWLNPTLGAIGAFEVLERALARLGIETSVPPDPKDVHT